MDKHVTHQGIALSLLIVSMFGLAHSWVAALDSLAPSPRQAIVAVAAQKMPPVQTSGIKGVSPGTVGQRYQGPSVISMTAYKAVRLIGGLQGGEKIK